jgi:hypothetical protein
MKALKSKNIWLSDMGPGPHEVEVLFGADTAAKLMTGDVHRIGSDLLAMNTQLGWTIMGSSSSEQQQSTQGMMVINSCLDSPKIEQLWKLEAIGILDSITVKSQLEKDSEAKKDFWRVLDRKSDGRYVVRLPWNGGQQRIPNNKIVAQRRLEGATTKLRSSGKYEAYNNVFLGWLNEGLIEFCEDDAQNECLEKGPNLIELIPSILLRFRRHRIGIVADIRKAYQMIEMCEEDRNFLRFLWWKPNGDLLTFRHCRVVFGVNCSAFILGAVIEHHLSQVNPKEVHIACKLQESLYVDNVVCSVDSWKEYEDFKSKSVEILAKAKMELQQWEQSTWEEPGVGSLVSRECGLGSGSCSSMEASSVTTVVGLKWDNLTDELYCDLPKDILQQEGNVTKR